MRVPDSDSYYSLMVTKRQEGAAPLTPRTRAGLCGRCSGKLVYDADLSADKCFACSRLAGPPAETPESARARVHSELSTLADGLDPVAFWQTYILANTVAEIIGMNSKLFRQWARTNAFEIITKRNPGTGRRSAFMEVVIARELIRFRM